MSQQNDKTVPDASAATSVAASVDSLRRGLLAELNGECGEDSLARPIRRFSLDGSTQAESALASQLFENYCRERRESTPAAEEAAAPPSESLLNLLTKPALGDLTGLMSGKPGVRLILPAVGEELFGFRLRHELGRGAFARVFLAEQADLAGRQVVLKISGIDGQEPQTLAQLQHTHIVAIYSVHEDTKAGLRVVCMPYFGGASLSRVLYAAWSERERPMHGTEIVNALSVMGSPKPGNATTAACSTSPSEAGGEAMSAANDHEPLAVLSELSYVQSAAWIVAHLADALQHAHERGVLHRDIKPSNILLAADGQPMLLDFNLAQDSNSIHSASTIGGTVAYMAPEHLRAFQTRDAALTRQLDRRADIYSLGMVLFEMLSGHSPYGEVSGEAFQLARVEAMAADSERTAPSPRAQRNDVPWSLESIVRKCLAHNPADRYQQAEHLADDLRRFLDDRPLKYAPELSWKERIRKWMRRHPKLTSSGSVGTVAALLLVGVVAASVGIWQQLGVWRALDRSKKFEEAVPKATCLLDTFNDLSQHQRKGIEVSEEALALYGILDRNDWQQHPDYQRLPTTDRQHLAEDAQELLVALAWTRVRGAPGDKDVVRGALALLDKAEAIPNLPPSRALLFDRARYLRLLGETSQADAAQRAAEQTEAVTARDHYMLGTTYQREGKHSQALVELNRGLELNPKHYWSWAQKGHCHYDAKQYTLAAADFGVCIGLWPEFAWGYFNRARALQESRNLSDAIQDYSAAIARDPQFDIAYLNRGLCHVELGHFAEALSDFDHAGDLGRHEALVYAGCGQALAGLGRIDEAKTAYDSAFKHGGSLSLKDRVRMRVNYAFAMSASRPDTARDSFHVALGEDPRNPYAFYGLGMIAATEKSTEEAVQYMTQALSAAPNFNKARRYRAVLLARLGKIAAASQDLNWCIEKDEERGPLYYAAACVASLAAGRQSDPTKARQAEEQAFTFLQQALDLGYGSDKALQDEDLSFLSGRPRFHDMIERAANGNKQRQP